MVDRLALGVQRDAAVKVARICTARKMVCIAQWNDLSLLLSLLINIEIVRRPVPPIAVLLLFQWVT